MPAVKSLGQVIGAVIGKATGTATGGATGAATMYKIFRNTELPTFFFEVKTLLDSPCRLLL
jgi:hypothetical protein